MPSPPVSPHTESDAEHTAELPAPDPTAHAHPGEHRMSQTDTWIAPAPPARLTEPSGPATRAARAAAEQRTAQLNTELGQVRAELAFQLDELTRARVQSEEQVAQSRAVLSTESARAEQLQRQLGEQESTTRTQRTLELEQRR